MPEGPEIWRTSDRLNEALANRKVTDLFFAFDRFKRYEEELVNLAITKVEPRGKALITRFENGLNIYSHNQLYGKWIVTDNGEQPETGRTLRIAIRNASNTARLYSATEIEVLDDRELENHDYLKNLGPDILHPETDFDKVFRQITKEEYQNRMLTSLFLDQGFLSGIGNYLRSEILFSAGVHPDMKLRDCSEDRGKALARASLDLSRRSYETGGITTQPNIVETLKREGSNRKNYRHFVYGRGGRRCHKCGTVVEVMEKGGRKVYYCPRCQSE